VIAGPGEHLPVICCQFAPGCFTLTSLLRHNNNQENFREKTLIKRTSLDFIKQQLEVHPQWRVLDIGCRKGGWPEADVYLDLADYSELYPGKDFVCGDACRMPFGDNSFDFIIASHILEHVPAPDLFLQELCRVAKAGYIEVPTPLADNIYSGNPEEHLWWVGFDDVDQKLIFQPPLTVIPELLRASDHRFLNRYFRQSLVTELLWQLEIPFQTPPQLQQRLVSSKTSRLLVAMRGLIRLPLYIIRRTERLVRK
jgi:SAM-dependent methyltransferase